MKAKSYDVPVLVRVKANSRREAEEKVSIYMGSAARSLFDDEPKIHASITHWALAELRAKK